MKVFPPLAILLTCGLLVVDPSNALARPRSGLASLIKGAERGQGVAVVARSLVPLEQRNSPEGFGYQAQGGQEIAAVQADFYGPRECAALPLGSTVYIVSFDQYECGEAPPSKTPEGAPALPDPVELAWLAAQRAMSLAERPDLQIAPKAKGLTGLRSYFWLSRRPAPASATASIPGLVVQAYAEPIRYRWSFGEGASRTTTSIGRPWTRRRDGNIGHTYERRGMYRVAVEVEWQAWWRMSGTGWRHLGSFTNSDSVNYPVRQMVAMLSRR